MDAEKIKYLVTIQYQTNTGIGQRTMAIDAISSESAFNLGADIVRAQRGVVRIQGGQCVSVSSFFCL
jgi:hypothetical protein